MNEKELAGTNIVKPCIQVKHRELTRISHSHYKSECPVCKKGMLLVHRNWDTLIIEEFDRYILCGQQFQYTDIEDLRQAEGSKTLTELFTAPFTSPIND